MVFSRLLRITRTPPSSPLGIFPLTKASFTSFISESFLTKNKALSIFYSLFLANFVLGCDKIIEGQKTGQGAEKLAIFGENRLLQIAINQGKANKLLGLKLHEIIRVEFK